MEQEISKNPPDCFFFQLFLAPNRTNLGPLVQASYGTTSTEHPSVAELFADLGKFYVGGDGDPSIRLPGVEPGVDGLAEMKWIIDPKLFSHFKRNKFRRLDTSSQSAMCLSMPTLWLLTNSATWPNMSRSTVFAIHWCVQAKTSTARTRGIPSRFTACLPKSIKSIKWFAVMDAMANGLLTRRGPSSQRQDHHPGSPSRTRRAGSRSRPLKIFQLGNPTTSSFGHSRSERFRDTLEVHCVTSHCFTVPCSCITSLAVSMRFYCFLLVLNCVGSKYEWIVILFFEKPIVGCVGVFPAKSKHFWMPGLSWLFGLFFSNLCAQIPTDVGQNWEFKKWNLGCFHWYNSCVPVLVSTASPKCSNKKWMNGLAEKRAQSNSAKWDA